MDASFTAILDSKMHAGFNEEFEFHGLDEAEMCDQKFYQSRANMVSCVHMSKMELDEPIKLLKGDKFPSFAIYFWMEEGGICKHIGLALITLLLVSLQVTAIALAYLISLA